MAENRREFTIPKQELCCKLEMYKVFVRIITGVDSDTGAYVEKWVTALEYNPKTFYYKDGEKAFEFGSIGYAMDFCFAAAVNGFCAKVEIVPTWTGEFDKYITNPKTEEDK